MDTIAAADALPEREDARVLLPAGGVADMPRTDDRTLGGGRGAPAG